MESEFGQQDVIATLIAGTLLLLFFASVIVVAAARYQRRKQLHEREIRRIKEEIERELLKTRLEVQEKTLGDVSREIHDNIGQILSVVKLNLHAIRPDSNNIPDLVTNSIGLINNAITDLRNLSKVLNSDFITNHSLGSLLEREVEIVNKAGFTCLLCCDWFLRVFLWEIPYGIRRICSFSIC